MHFSCGFVGTLNELGNLQECVKELTFSTGMLISSVSVMYKIYTKSKILYFYFILGSDNCEDSEYIPSEESSSDTEASYPQDHVTIVNNTVSSSSTFDISNIVNRSACNDEDMHVENSNSKSTKQYFCMFCMKLQSQLPRHLETIHHNEPEI